MNRSRRPSVPGVLLVLVCLPGCTGGDAVVTAEEGGFEPGAPSPVERGAPLDAPLDLPPDIVVEPQPATVDDPGTPASIQDVAQGLGGVDPSDIAVIDDRMADSTPEGVTAISWADLSMQELPMEDLLDSLLYPEDYADEEDLEFPDRICKHDGQVIAIVGYMIPLEWKETTVPEFMLVRDLLGCCFGGSPMPDEWINVKMVDEGAEYFPYIPVIVTGEFRIEGIEDEAGYAAGCFHIAGTSVNKEL